MAPEIINLEYYGFKVDTWSACVVAYTLLCGETPFQISDEYFSVKQAINQKEISFEGPSNE